MVPFLIWAASDSSGSHKSLCWIPERCLDFISFFPSHKLILLVLGVYVCFVPDFTVLRPGHGRMLLHTVRVSPTAGSRGNPSQHPRVRGRNTHRMGRQSVSGHTHQNLLGSMAKLYLTIPDDRRGREDDERRRLKDQMEIKVAPSDCKLRLCRTRTFLVSLDKVPAQAIL